MLLQEHLNKEVENIYYWFCANRLSLNVDKSNFVIFHAPQKKISNEIKLGITIARKVLPRNLKQMEILMLDKIYALGH